MHNNRNRKNLLFAMLLGALLCACAVRPEPELLSATRTPSEIETTFIEVVSPSPTPQPHLDLDAYCIDAQNGVYDILPLLEKSGQTLLHAGFCAKNELLLFSTDPQGIQLIVERFRLDTGTRSLCFSETLPEPIREADAFLYYGMNPPALYDTAADELLLFSSDCTALTRLPVNGLIFSECRWDGHSLLLFDEADRTLKRLTPDGTETALFHPGYQYRNGSLLSFDRDGRYASITATDNRTDEDGTLLIDLSNGSILGWQPGEVRLAFSENGYATLTRNYEWNEAESRTELVFKSADKLDADTVYLVRQERTDYYPTIYPAAGNYLFEDWNGDYTLRVAEASGQNAMRLIVPLDPYQAVADALREAAPTPDPDREEDGDDLWFLYPRTERDGFDGHYTLTSVLCGTERIGMLLWDTSRGESETTPGITMAEPLFVPIPAVTIDCGDFAERIARIHDSYGITVLLGEEANLSMGTHSAEPLPIAANRDLLDSAFDILESTLSDCPPQFFQTLCQGSLDGIVLEFCGTIRSTDTASLDFPSALTRTLDRYRVIVLDTHFLSDMRYTIFHEVSHMIDTKLDDDPNLDEAIWSSEGWDALNPSGFSYYFAYNEEDGDPYDVVGSSDYTEWDSAYQEHGKQEAVYFVDIYSKTFPTEDRAVLLGTLLRDDENDALLRCPHLFEKLCYYAHAIRACFDPDGTLWSEPTVWERRIESLQNDIGENAA